MVAKTHNKWKTCFLLELLRDFGFFESSESFHSLELFTICLAIFLDFLGFIRVLWEVSNFGFFVFSFDFGLLVSSELFGNCLRFLFFFFEILASFEGSDFVGFLSDIFAIRH